MELLEVSIITNFIAGIIALIFFKRLDPKFHFFIYFIWIGCITDLISYSLFQFRIYSNLLSNIYILVAFLMLSGFFLVNNYVRIKTAGTLILAFIFTWTIETFILRNPHQIGSYYRILYSAIITLYAIHTINHVFFSGSTGEMTKSLLLICFSLITLLVFKILIEAFWIYGLELDHQVSGMIYQIQLFIMIITNLVFALAILWIPNRQPSLLLS